MGKMSKSGQWRSKGSRSAGGGMQDAVENSPESSQWLKHFSLKLVSDRSNLDIIRGSHSRMGAGNKLCG